MSLGKSYPSCAVLIALIFTLGLAGPAPQAKAQGASPGNVPGLQLWLSSGAGVVKDSAGAVSRWQDQSGHQHDLFQEDDPGARPLWADNVVQGKPAVRFDGLNDYLKSQKISAFDTDRFTVFVVARLARTAGQQQVLLENKYTIGGGSPWYHQLWGLSNVGSTQTYRFFSHASNSNLVLSQAPSSTEFTVLSGLWSASDDVALWLNGAAQAAGTGANAAAGRHNKLTLGANSFNHTDNLAGDVAEVLIYNTALDDAQRKLVEDYLLSLYIRREVGPGDDDGDGMPNQWEAQHGLNPTNPADAQTDLDNDGVNNLTEYLQGRNPTVGTVADSGGYVSLDVWTPLEP